MKPISPSAQIRLLIALLFVCFCASVEAREITDMVGRKVVLPDTVTRAASVSPPGTYLLYAIDPSVVAGLNFPLWDNEKKYTTEGFKRLPVIGGMAGQGRTLNAEVLLKIKPDFVLIWAWNDSAIQKKYEELLTALHLPWVHVRLDTLMDYPDALLFMGDVLNRKERAKKLYRYATDVLKTVKAAVAGVPAGRKLTVYYAEGTDGLLTERTDSTHVELISLAGGINVHKGAELNRYGMEKVSMEQVILYDPEVILVKEKSFHDAIFNDPRWRGIRAVRNRRVYLIPYVPFNWFDRPPSFMRLLGLKWLASTLYPHLFPADMVKETKEFYKLFLGVELNDREAREVLCR